MAMPATDWAARVEEAELADLEQIWRTLDLPGHRIELIDGQVVVSPTASVWHSKAIDRLIDSLTDIKRRNGWVFHTNLTVHITATRERLIPDLMIAPNDAPAFGDDELLAHGVLLVAEVVSPSRQRRDRVAKLRAYAQGRVALYLLIDELADPATLTLFSDPDEDAYRTCHPATAGQALRLPEPFGISLDTRRLLG
jgi:Uma2 family endonuclease